MDYLIKSVAWVSDSVTQHFNTVMLGYGYRLTQPTKAYV
jgi:hypothetical protein